MIRRPPRSTRTDTLFPYTTLFRSDRASRVDAVATAGADNRRHNVMKGQLRFPSSGVVRIPCPPEMARSRGKRRHAEAVVRRRHHGTHDRTGPGAGSLSRSEERTSELQSLMRSSYAVFCLKKKKTRT